MHDVFRFLLVTLDHRTLETARARDNSLEGDRVAPDERRRVALHFVEVRGVEHDAVLDHFRQSRAELAFRQGQQRGGVGQHEARLVKGADQVLGARVIDGRLASARCVHLGQERRRHLDEVDASHIGGRGEAREIPDRATTQRDDG